MSYEILKRLIQDNFTQHRGTWDALTQMVTSYYLRHSVMIQTFGSIFIISLMISSLDTDLNPSKIQI